ncbi:hypothetical protein [Streptomyces pseudovenezuelae]|uniref:hypothetical protein n=1 Tax=Streptomyces pseudovenezuelae TaxID=67350 RepID=UPI002E311324|nr:hypothetical protein [Streptomyces pseudovenezuelae]
MAEAAQVLKELVEAWSVQIDSTSALAGAVADATAKDDKERREDGREPLRRKPGLRALPATEVGPSFRLTPWDVLHALGRAAVLSRQGAGRGLAEHWGCLKYCQALDGSPGRYMALSEEGLNPGATTRLFSLASWASDSRSPSPSERSRSGTRTT